MPTEVSSNFGGLPNISGISPLPSVTSHRLQSPVKSRLTKENLSKFSKQTIPPDQFSTVAITSDAPLGFVDDQLQDSDNIFITESNIRELDAINEEDFEGEPTLAESRSIVVDLDENTYQPEDTNVSGKSSVSEIEPDADYDTDIELETDKWLHPDLYDRDTTGVNRYLRMCQRLEIQPITYFLKHMQNKELKMKYHGLGPLGVKAMADPLEINTTIEKMDLEGNYILGIGATYLSKVLKENVYLTELILSENKIGNMGAKAICELLVENKTITFLDLKGNVIDDGAAEELCNMLSRNTDLKTLILRNNSFEDDGAMYIKDALIDNDTLITLDLSWNHFQSRGCCAIAEGIKQNQGLKHLNLCMNGFGIDGAKVLEEALKNNHTLLELDISFCRIPLPGAPHIASGLQNNDTLEKLNIGYNLIQGEGGYVVLVSAERNQHGCLKHLNFGNLTVKLEFKKIADTLVSERNMTILYGGVMLDVVSFRNAKYDPWAAHVNDPMTKLTQWLEQAQYRLVDLLLTFDRDKTLSIDLNELKQGIKNAGIPLTELEVEILMKNLDADNSGTIDMKELVQGAEQHTLLAREAERFKEEQDRVDAVRRRESKAGDVKDFQKMLHESELG